MAEIRIQKRSKNHRVNWKSVKSNECDFQSMVDERFIDMCAVCKQGVTKTMMIYKNGRVFHQRCFETKGNMFPPINQEIAQLSARTRIELVEMKNLKVRSDAGLLRKTKPSKKKVSRKKASKKSRITKKPSKSKPRKKR